MNIEEIREYCLNKKGAIECFPFDGETLVFKVKSKMFVLIPLDAIPKTIAVKCDPEKALVLREKYAYVYPAWHMNKKYWNQVWFDRDVDDDLLCRLILHSRDEVVKKWSKKKQEEYAKLISAE